MKVIRKPAALLLMVFAAAGGSRAAVPVTEAGAMVDFNVVPAGEDFAGVLVAGGGGDLTTWGISTGGIDNPATGVGATLAWPAALTNWMAAANQIAAEPEISTLDGRIRYVPGTGRMLTGPTSIRYQALIGRFRNAAAAPIVSFDLQWTLGTPVDSSGTGAEGADPLAGIHVYFSRTGTPGSWQTLAGPFASPDGAVPVTTIRIPGRLPVNEDCFLAWVDDNGPGSAPPNAEGHYTIDDIIISDVGVSTCAVSAAGSAPARLPGASAVDPADDTVFLSITIHGNGAVGPGWVISSDNRFSGTTGAYGENRFFSIPISDFTAGPMNLRFADQADPDCYFDLPVAAPAIVHRVTATSSPVITFTPAAAGDGSYSPPPTVITEPGWTGGTSGALTNSNVQTQPVPATGTNKYFHLTTTGVTLTTDRVDVSALRGSVLRGSVEMAFYSTNSSGLDTNDEIVVRLEVARNGNFSNTTEGNILTTDIRRVAAGEGPDFGASIAAAPAYLNLGTASGQTPFPQTAFTFHTLAANLPIPAGASNPHARIVVESLAGITTSEHLLIDNITFRANTAPTIEAAVAGSGEWHHGNTVTTADDHFSVPVRITAFNAGASPGWISNETPSRTGSYADPDPVTFGPLPGRTPFSLQLRDSITAGVTSGLVSLAPPSASLSAGVVPGSVVREENGPGPEDDTVSLQMTVLAANLGPEFTAAVPLLPVRVSGAGPYSPDAGTPLTLKLENVPAAEYTINIEIADASYPSALTPVTLAVLIPAAAAGPVIMARTDFGGTVADVPVSGQAAPEWASWPGSRQLVMTAAPASGDAVTASEVIDLSSTGTVLFTAKFSAIENSALSNFESSDRFRAELILNGDAGNPVNLVASLDAGGGESATSTATAGRDGPKNGYLNGYTGTAGTDILSGINYAVPPLTARDEYNANRDRDELNTIRAPVTALLNGTIILSAVIPASASSAQLRIHGGGISSSESFIFGDAVFTGVSGGDSDGDGASDIEEGTAGTNPNDARDVLRLAQSPALREQFAFPSKTGRFYRVYASDADSALTGWKDAGLGTITGNGGTRTFSIPLPAAPARRYFRLHVMPADGPWPP